jgi:hypothetical protein
VIEPEEETPEKKKDNSIILLSDPNEGNKKLTIEDILRDNSDHE